MAREGLIPFNIPGIVEPAQTWYQVVGDMNTTSTPLIVLHGGPGACHEYLSSLTALQDEHDIPLIFYDQVGNGNSTHLDDKAGDKAFWNEWLFHAELDNLIDKLELRDRKAGYDIFGHSWGAMVAGGYATKQPKGLRKLVLMSGGASMETWLEGVNGLRAQLPQKVRDTLSRCEREGRMDSPEYEEALTFFYQEHLCRIKPWPAEAVQQALDHMTGDPTVYSTMYGASELVVTGSLQNWTIVDQIHRIESDTLLLNGRYDEAQDVTMMPFYRRIPHVEWTHFEHSSHFAHVEEKARFIEVVAGFLGGRD